MQPKIEPTTDQNAATRLFVRLLLCYLVALPIAVLAHFEMPLPLERVGTAELFFVLAAVWSGISTLTKPLLLLLTVLKAFFDLAMLKDILISTAAGLVGILPFNACLLFAFATLAVYLLAASRAEYFTFRHTARDSQLLLSRPFWHYLLGSACFMAVAVLLALLWQQIYPLLFELN